MVLSAEDIKKFQALYKSEFGKEIRFEDAQEKGIRLLNLMSAIYKPMTQAEFERIQAHRKNTTELLHKRMDSLKFTDNM